MEYEVPRKKSQSTSSKVKGSVCDGCRAFEVLTSGKRIVKERYWCNRKKQQVDPWVGCGKRV